MGDRNFLGSTIARLAFAECDLGNFAEAEALARRGASLAASDDFDALVYGEAGRARALAGLGRLDEAEQIAAHAVERAQARQFPVDLADALSALADVHILAGRPRDAADVYGQAAECHRRKGDEMGATRIARRLARNAHGRGDPVPADDAGATEAR
jgi:tetratricopeptide (TPR) repeat protein